MKTYQTTLFLEVEAENEEEAVDKFHELLASGKVNIDMVEEK